MRLYVNIYELSSNCGGAEEGGWWYDSGRVIGSVPVELTADELCELERVLARTPATTSPQERVAALVHLRAESVAANYRLRYPSTGDRRKVHPGEDYGVYIEDHFGHDWPTEAPRYE